MVAHEKSLEEAGVRSEGTGFQTRGFLEVRCRVVEVAKSYIPEVVLYTVDCGDVKMKFDIHSKLLKLKRDDEVTVSISRDAPEFRKGVDLLAWGYVMSLKRGESSYKMVLSLWGYVVVVETVRQEALSGFNFMDKVYFKVAKSSTSVGT
ncbi:MAG: DNA-directed RNA polymerase subunit G [Sulfolobales archaeon]|nr:DNA-directed RNA polymerase subunit G [Sulfolobales archaeon]